MLQQQDSNTISMNLAFCNFKKHLNESKSDLKLLKSCFFNFINIEASKLQTKQLLEPQ